MTPAGGTLPVAQSVLAPASHEALRIDGLTTMMIIGAALIFVLTLLVLVRAATRKAGPINAQRWLIGGGLVLPVIVLSALLAEGLRVGATLAHDPQVDRMEVQVVARRWWWELRYRHPDGQTQVVLANELHLPMDCITALSVETADVIHSAWIPALAGKVDAIPGQRNRLVIHPTREGRYRGQCAEYCGTQHANMGLEVVVESPAQFRDWLLAQALPARVPTDAGAQRGQQVFADAGCGACHTIRGSGANGVLGPDLTHVASRRTVAAATLENHSDALVHWLRNAQHVKPGNLMPGMPDDTPDSDVAALASYLGSLR